MMMHVFTVMTKYDGMRFTCFHVFTRVFHVQSRVLPLYSGTCSRIPTYLRAIYVIHVCHVFPQIALSQLPMKVSLDGWQFNR